MFTFSHELAPTVSYNGALPEAMSRYVKQHLFSYKVELFATDDALGVGMRVVCNTTGNSLGNATIH